MNATLRKFLKSLRISGAAKKSWLTASLMVFIVFASNTYSWAQYYQRIYATSAPADDADATWLLADIDDREDALAPSYDVQKASTLED